MKHVVGKRRLVNPMDAVYNKLIGVSLLPDNK
jgi:hypothetical protein